MTGEDKRPSVDDTFLVRICLALGQTPRALASNIGVPYSAIKPLLGARSLLVEMDMDDTWAKIDAYVSTRIGLLLAAKYEMNKALQDDKKRRVLQRERFKAFHDNR